MKNFYKIPTVLQVFYKFINHFKILLSQIMVMEEA